MREYVLGFSLGILYIWPGGLKWNLTQLYKWVIGFGLGPIFGSRCYNHFANEIIELNFL